MNAVPPELRAAAAALSAAIGHGTWPADMDAVKAAERALLAAMRHAGLAAFAHGESLYVDHAMGCVADQHGDDGTNDVSVLPLDLTALG